MAHKKGQGSSRNGRDSASKRLGVNKFGVQAVISGNILIRQRFTKFNPVSYSVMLRDCSLCTLIVCLLQLGKGDVFVHVVSLTVSAD